MKSIEEIIKEFEQLIKPSNNEMENLINDAMPAVIEGFIEFYGEECRKEITEKFSKIKVVIPTYDFEEVFEYILGIQLNEYMQSKYPDEYEKFYLSDLKYIDEKADKSEEYINDLNKIKNKITPYQEFNTKYLNLQKIIFNKVHENTNTEINEFVKKMLREKMGFSSEMLGLNDYEFAGEKSLNRFFGMFNDEKFYDINGPLDLSCKIQALRELGINIPPLNCEDKEYWKWNESEFKSAKEEFIEMINDPNIKKYIPSKEFVTELMNKAESIHENKNKQAHIEFVNQIYGIKYDFPNYLGFDLSPILPARVAGSYNPFLRKNKNKTEMVGIVTINRLSEKKQIGQFLIHEYNHGIETTIIDNGTTYSFKSGYDIALTKNSNNHEIIATKNIYRPQELLNECINDMITMEIYNIVRKRTNNIIFSDFGIDVYSNAFFVVEEFYKLYKTEIIESRKNHNMDALYQKIGYENFKSLEELMQKISIKVYGGIFEYEQAKQDLNNGIINDKSEYLIYVINERDRILNSMKEYSQTSHRNRGNITINSIISLLITIFIFIYISLIILKLK